MFIKYTSYSIFPIHIDLYIRKEYWKSEYTLHIKRIQTPLIHDKLLRFFFCFFYLQRH